MTDTNLKKMQLVRFDDKMGDWFVGILLDFNKNSLNCVRTGFNVWGKFFVLYDVNNKKSYLEKFYFDAFEIEILK